jgi:hypothetical protein
VELGRSIKACAALGPAETALSATGRSSYFSRALPCNLSIALVFAVGLAAPAHADEPVATESLPEAATEATASLTNPQGEGNLSDTSLPGNPNAIDQCLAKVRVGSARLRASPSLSSEIVGMRSLEQPLFVRKVVGKWAMVALENGDTAYVAAYLLTFSWQDLLEQWKKTAPQPTVGKKAKLKWVKARDSFNRWKKAPPSSNIRACLLSSNGISSATG